MLRGLSMEPPIPFLLGVPSYPHKPGPPDSQGTGRADGWSSLSSHSLPLLPFLVVEFGGCRCRPGCRPQGRAPCSSPSASPSKPLSSRL